jgi:hypothetical protein
MSTIIERLARAAAIAGLITGVWSSAMMVLPFVGPSGRQVAVVGDRGEAIRAVLAAGGTIVEARGRAVIARSDRPGFAAALYRSGARLVLESRIAAGCLSLAEPRRVR